MPAWEVARSNRPELKGLPLEGYDKRRWQPSITLSSVLRSLSIAEQTVYYRVSSSSLGRQLLSKNGSNGL